MADQSREIFKACVLYFETVIRTVAEQTGLEAFKDVFTEILEESLSTFSASPRHVAMSVVFQTICLKAELKCINMAPFSDF